MIKKVIALTMVIFLLVPLAACNLPEEKDLYTLLESGICCQQSEHSNSYWENIAKSMKVYEEAITHFKNTNEKNTDDFGGVFVDENGLYNICVVGNRKPVTSNYLIYKNVKNSLNFLEDIVNEISNNPQEFSVWRISICEKCNRVLICLDDEIKISSLIELLKANNLFQKNTLNIFVDENRMIIS